ncbi:MAG: UDP-N-acetylmuramate dehydrogenase [Acidobacteriota bacterium]|nr:UDP-N-acetylmuramate dehydrogenase [Acidobacteriota bacterium]
MATDNLPIQTQIPLAPKTTIGIGGPARYYLEATTEEMVTAGIQWAAKKNLPFFLLGGGSNLLLADEGFPGLVIALCMRGRKETHTGDHVILDIAAGEDWDDLVAFTVARNLAGIECLSGIPGKAGAAPIQNIGAYGQEIADTLVDVRVLDLTSMETQVLTRRACRFGYRDSLFKQEGKGRYVVLSLRLQLTPDGKPTIRYPDLERRLGPDASLAEVRETVLAVRRGKSMVADPTDPNARSCGSFFTNPILDASAYAAFKARLPQFGLSEHPNYPGGPGKTKLSAAWLIERSGFGKGLVYKGVGLSQKHCLALINRGQGTATEALELVARIQKGVMERFGVQLEPEPVILK